MVETVWMCLVLLTGSFRHPGLPRSGADIDAWYKAFNVQPGEKMYKTPDQRFKVW